MSAGPDPTSPQNPNNPFGGLMPSLDMWKGLFSGAQKAVPGLSSLGAWATPTLDPAELDKRIEELRTVQFWLEQNAKMIGTTIQALEVQRMTLSTLQTLNVKFADLKEAMSVRPAAPAPSPNQSPAPSPAPARPSPMAAAADDDSVEADAGLGGADHTDAGSPAAQPSAGGGQRKGPSGAAPAPAAPIIDPMQWWGQLTQQFSQIAQQAQQAVGSPVGASNPPEAPAAPAKRASRPPSKPTPKPKTKAALKPAARPSASGARKPAGSRKG